MNHTYTIALGFDLVALVTETLDKTVVDLKTDDTGSLVDSSTFTGPDQHIHVASWLRLYTKAEPAAAEHKRATQAYNDLMLELEA